MIARCLVVGAGGFLGAIALYAGGVWIETFWRRDFPLATFLVNVSGFFILGFFLAIATERMSISPMMRLLVATASSARTRPSRRSSTRRSG